MAILSDENKKAPNTDFSIVVISMRLIGLVKINTITLNKAIMIGAPVTVAEQ